MPLVVLVSFSGIFLACFFAALFKGEQFGYRDAEHYYYPLHERVAQEWSARRIPLWEPEENGGMPLAGNPTAAVFYPGKVVFALLPLAWAARVYIVMHTALAFVAMMFLMRSWGASQAGAAIAGLVYAFGAPILFQYCNVIFLIGAAWLPLGFHAVDAFVARGKRLALLELAAVIAMITLGGDPQAAYLLGLCAGGYAWLMARARQTCPQLSLSSDSNHTVFQWSAGRNLLASCLFLAMWLLTLVAAAYVPTLREHAKPTPPLWWMRYVPGIVTGCWAFAAAIFLWRWYRGGKPSRFGVACAGLLGSAILAFTLGAVQLLPVMEFTQQTARASFGGPHELYPFSIEPYRAIELLWPNIFGDEFRGNTYWLDAFQLPGIRPKIWTPSLYLGGLAWLLALCAMSLRKGSPRRIFLSALVLLSFLGGLGLYTSPIWTTRFASALRDPKDTNMTLAKAIGPLDAADAAAIRQDGWLKDGDGSFYWWMATVLPGFRQFRYPAKLFTFTALGIAALAAMGWDRVRARPRPAIILGASALCVTILALAAVAFKKAAILEAFKNTHPTAFGPFDRTGGYWAIVASLAQAACVLAAGLALFASARKYPLISGALAVALFALDLGLANSRSVLTVPQTLFEGRPEVLRLIDEAEKNDPARGPYRIHRMAAWNPPGWLEKASPDRLSDFAHWQRDTIQPKHGISQGVEYAYTMGVAELYDYEWYFSGFERKLHDPLLAKALGIELEKTIVYYPRRAYDMWGARYFIIPSFPNGWKDELRATASFRWDNKQIYPDPARFRGPGGVDRFREWVKTNDFEIHRNLNAYPRAWVVHQGRPVRPLEGLSRESRTAAIQEILYANDQIWKDETMVAFDPRQVAWVEATDFEALAPALSLETSHATETVTVNYPDPQHAVLEADLITPGIVVLADVYYPGWKLTIDGVAAPIYRVNRLMRGAAVPRGKHTLVYSYEPTSFRLGAMITFAGFVLAAMLAIFLARKPIEPALADQAA